MARLGAALVLLLLAGCATPQPRAPLWRAERGVVWCYATLAEPDCYRQPQPGAERRLIAAAPQRSFSPLAAGARHEVPAVE
jgi:hypothetical protein